MSMTEKKYKVCGVCKGEGKIVSRVLSIWTAGDIERDPDGFRAMRRGAYDVRCPQCKGLRVVTRQQEHEYQEAREEARERAYEPETSRR